MVDILSIGASGLAAYRKLLETVGGNITNASTEGYLRRDVQTSTTGEAGMLPTSANVGNGSGVIVDTVRRASDYYLQTQSLKANALTNQMQTLADALTRLEKNLFVTDNNPGAAVQDFYSRFSDVAGSPTSAASRLAVLDSGTRVAQVFSQTASSIEDTLTSIKTGLNAALDQVNSYTDQLARLNIQIQSVTTGSQKPNDLLDQRDKILSKLSDLVGFTYTEQSSGAITVYLGDTASGRTLLGPDGAHPLGAVETNGRLDINLDPFTNPAPTNQLTSGTVAGLLNFRAETLHVLENVNRLAVGFSVAVNAQHKQGIDQNGNPGKALFSTDGVAATAGALNKGDAKLSISVSDAAKLGDIHYTARFNASTGRWTVTSSDGASKTGADTVSLDGLDFHFAGRASDGDTFAADPLFGAAASTKFLISTPGEIASALPLYVDPFSTNIGSASLTPLKRTTQDPTSLIPAASSIFDGVNTSADFLSNGPAFTLSPSTTPLTLTSLNRLSAVHFTTTGLSSFPGASNQGNASVTATIPSNASIGDIDYFASYNANAQIWTVKSSEGKTSSGTNTASIDGITFSFNGLPADRDSFSIRRLPMSASDITAIGQNSTGGSELSLSIELDGEAKSLAISTKSNDLNQIAADINNAAVKAGYQNYLYASVVNGALTVNALGAHSVANAGFKGYNTQQQPVEIKAVNEIGASAAQIRVFTREGRQIFGPILPPSGREDFLTPANGFLPGLSADDYKNYTQPPPIYPGANITPASNLLSVSGDFSNTTINVSALPEFNMAHGGGGQPVVSGAVYALNVNGLAPIRLAGDALAGKSAPDVANALAGQMNAQASKFSWRGSNLSLADTTRVLSFDVSIDGKPPQRVIFHRATDPATGSMALERLEDPTTHAVTYKPAYAGTFEVPEGANFTASLVPGTPAGPGMRANARVLISAPQTLRNTAPTISITPVIDPTLFDTDQGLNISTVNQQPDTLVTGTGDLQTSLLAATKPTLKLSVGGVQKTLTIDSISGSSAGVSWSMVDGKLQLSGNAAMSIDTSGDGATLARNLGIDPAASGTQILATDLSIDTLLASKPMTIEVKDAQYQAPSHTLTINSLNGPSPSTDPSGITWSFNGKNLTLIGPRAGLLIDASDSNKAADAQALGFNGSDLDLSVSGEIMTLKSNNTTNAGLAALADPSASVSRVGSGLTFSTGVPEDLIVAVVNDDPSGVRTVAASKVDAPPPDGVSSSAAPVPPIPNIRVKIISDSQLEIIDPASGLSLAYRAWEPDKPINYRGLSFTIHGTTAVNDVYDVKTDPTRTADNRNALMLAGMATVSIFGQNGGSFQDVYNNVTSKLGTAVNSANMTAAGAAQQASDLKSAFEAKTGVNLDTEASDLIRYQQAYSAAAQVVMAARDMFSTILRSF